MTTARACCKLVILFPLTLLPLDQKQCKEWGFICRELFGLGTGDYDHLTIERLIIFNETKRNEYVWWLYLILGIYSDWSCSFR